MVFQYRARGANTLKGERGLVGMLVGHTFASGISVAGTGLGKWGLNIDVIPTLCDRMRHSPTACIPI